MDEAEAFGLLAGGANRAAGVDEPLVGLFADAAGEPRDTGTGGAALDARRAPAEPRARLDQMLGSPEGAGLPCSVCETLRDEPRRAGNKLTGMMRRVDLREHEESGPHTLSVAQRDAVASATKSLAVTPIPGESSAYTLKPGSTVGAIEVGDLSVLIRPKIGIPQLLSLACYAIGKVKFQPEDFDFPDEDALPDVLALALAFHARRAFSRGLLRGYRTEEEALYTVRGRIRFDEQIRRRFGVPLPVELRYDEFTDDILANRLVKAAAYRLGRMRLRSAKARAGLGWVVGILDNVSMVEFPGSNVPAVTFDRLNEHYRSVVELSRLVLRHSAFQSARGQVRASGFLVDMNVLFQEFLTVALREALGVSADTLCSNKELKGRRRIYLDKACRVKLEPDITWWDGSSFVFVGDAKYKSLTGEGGPNADLYQVLAYATALDLSAGLLVYAEGEAGVATYRMQHSGKRLEVAALDLCGTLDQALSRVEGLADKVRELRDETRALRPRVGAMSS